MGRLDHKVLVVGGSFAGIRLARLLSPSSHVTLVDPKGYFEYTPGILHTLTGSGAYRKISSPLQDIVNSYTYIKGYFIGFQPHLKKAYFLENNNLNTQSVKSFEYDSIILCSGMPYSTPIRPSHTYQSTNTSTYEDRIHQISSFCNQLHAAGTVLIIGGGLVGVELAAEIVTRLKESKDHHNTQSTGISNHNTGSKQSRYHQPNSNKKKRVILITRSTLLETLPTKAGMTALNWLQDHQVEVILQDEIIEIHESTNTMNTTSMNTTISNATVTTTTTTTTTTTSGKGLKNEMTAVISTTCKSEAVDSNTFAPSVHSSSSESITNESESIINESESNTKRRSLYEIRTKNGRTFEVDMYIDCTGREKINPADREYTLDAIQEYMKNNRLNYTISTLNGDNIYKDDTNVTMDDMDDIMTNNLYLYPFQQTNNHPFKGVVVNEYFESTYFPNMGVYAVGDCAIFQHPIALGCRSHCDAGDYAVLHSPPLIRNAHLIDYQANICAYNILMKMKQSQYVQSSSSNSPSSNRCQMTIVTILRSCSFCVIHTLQSILTLQRINTRKKKTYQNDVVLKRYPYDVFGGDIVPLSVCVSLGPNEAILILNDLVIGGSVWVNWIGAVMKFIIERTIVAEIRGKLWAIWFWKIAHFIMDLANPLMHRRFHMKKKNENEISKITQRVSSSSTSYNVSPITTTVTSTTSSYGNIAPS